MKANFLLARLSLRPRVLTAGLATLVLATTATTRGRPPVASAHESSAVHPELSAALALNPSGAAYAWGSNSYGQLGNGSTTDNFVPKTVSASADGNFTNTGVTAVAAGGLHGLAIQNGAVYAWGGSYAGQLGNGTTANSSVPVAVSNSNDNSFYNYGVTAVAAGNAHSLAVQNGAAYAWGSNSSGQLGSLSGTQLVPVAVLNLTSGVTAVAAGYEHSLAVQNGAAYAWGLNSNGQLGNGSTGNVPLPRTVLNLTSGVTAVAAGSAHSLAVQNGVVYAWGYNVYGQLGNGSTTDNPRPSPVSSVSGGFANNSVTAVAGGSLHSLALRSGNVFAWGLNDSGQLGNGSKVRSFVPVAVSFGGASLGGIVQVAAGQNSSYALAGDGSLYVWGDNTNGQLGDGGTSSQLTPEHLLPPSGLYYQLIDSNGISHATVAVLGRTPPVVTPTVAISPKASSAYNFTFPTQTGVTYQLQTSGDLSTWTNVAGQPTTGDGTVQTLSDVNGPTKKFWRLSLSLSR